MISLTLSSNASKPNSIPLSGSLSKRPMSSLLLASAIKAFLICSFLYLFLINLIDLYIGNQDTSSLSNSSRTEASVPLRSVSSIVLRWITKFRYDQILWSFAIWNSKPSSVSLSNIYLSMSQIKQIFFMSSSLSDLRPLNCANESIITPKIILRRIVITIIKKDAS